VVRLVDEDEGLAVLARVRYGRECDATPAYVTTTPE
jgi:hypothetical protein